MPAHHPTHPLQADRRTAALWIAAALAGTACVALLLVVYVHAATGLGATSWALVALLGGLVFAAARRQLRARSWAHIHRRPQTRHLASILLDGVHSLMVMVVSLAILTYITPTTTRAAFVVTAFGIGLVTVVVGLIAGRGITAMRLRCDKSPLVVDTSFRWFPRNVQPLVAGIVIVVFALRHAPQAGSYVLPLAAIWTVSLAVAFLLALPFQRTIFSPQQAEGVALPMHRYVSRLAKTPRPHTAVPPTDIAAHPDHQPTPTARDDSERHPDR